MQNKTKIILGVVGAILVIYIYTHLFAYWMNRRAGQQAVPVAVGVVEQKDIVIPLQTIGTVQAYSTVSVKSLVDGQLLQAGFKEGDFVKKDQLLFQIDSRPFQDSLAQAQANLTRDQAQLDNAHSQVARNKALAQKGYVAAEAYDQLVANEKAATATVLADQAAVANAQLQLDYSTIKSPIDGRTGSLLVYPGNIIKTANSTVLVTITQVNPIYVAFAVPQQYLASIRSQQNIAPVDVKATIANEIEDGKLTFIDNTVDITTGTIQLKATFENAKLRLWPGQFVTVTIPTTALSHALLVPSQAVQAGQAGSYVYVVQPDNTVNYQLIKSGPSSNNQTVVLQGLKRGDQVVTDGLMRLSDGARVQIVTGKALGTSK